MHERPSGSRWRGFAAETRDAVTPHAFLLVCGIALLQLAFIASYIGAFQGRSRNQRHSWHQRHSRRQGGT